MYCRAFTSSPMLNAFIALARHTIDALHSVRVCIDCFFFFYLPSCVRCVCVYIFMMYIWCVYASTSNSASFCFLSCRQYTILYCLYARTTIYFVTATSAMNAHCCAWCFDFLIFFPSFFCSMRWHNVRDEYNIRLKDNRDKDHWHILGRMWILHFFIRRTFNLNRIFFSDVTSMRIYYR